MDTVHATDITPLWAPARQLTLAQARRRSFRVRWVRYAFLAAAAASIGLFAGYILRTAITQDARPLYLDESEAITMINPRFTGRDASGAIFTITAEAAKRRRTRDDAIDLVSPVLRDGNGSEVSAPSGFYDRASGILELYQDVKISDSAGYRFQSEGARVFTNENRIEGLAPLIGSGPLGDIAAESYEILDGGNRVVFKGRVRTVIYPDDTVGTENTQDALPDAP
jgi:lipopolysaccharide export system protein LptC